MADGCPMDGGYGGIENCIYSKCLGLFSADLRHLRTLELQPFYNLGHLNNLLSFSQQFCERRSANIFSPHRSKAVMQA